MDDDTNSTRTDDSDQCTFSKHEWLLTKFIITSVIGTSLAIFGVWGNLTTIAVLTRPMMRTPNNLYLTFLAVFDILVLILGVTLYSMEYVQEYFDDENMYVVWMDYAPYMYALSNFAQTGSVYITVSVTLERYLAVVHPRIAQYQCTRPRAGWVILIVVSFSAIFNMPKFFEISIIRNENCTGFASRMILPSQLLLSPMYSTIYSLWLSQLIMIFIPFGVLLAVNTAIVWNFRRSLKKLDCSIMHLDRGMLKEQSRDATRVLITIVVVFLICNCWSFVITLLENIYGSDHLRERVPKFYTFSREAINFLAIINSSINFVICVTFSDDFRGELLVLYGCKRRKRAKRSRRKAFSTASRPGLFTRSSKSSIIAANALHKIRYVDRLHSAESLANKSSSGSASPKVPSFSALIEAAQMFISRSMVTADRTIDTSPKSMRRDSHATRETSLLQRKCYGSNGYLQNNNHKTASSEKDISEPFLYKNNFFSDFEIEWEAIL